MSFGMDQTDEIRTAHRVGMVRAGNAATLAGQARREARRYGAELPDWVAGVSGFKHYTRAEESRLVGELLRLLDSLEPEECPF